jgi:hypothetical protein
MNKKASIRRKFCPDVSTKKDKISVNKKVDIKLPLNKGKAEGKMYLFRLEKKRNIAALI